ARPAWASAPEIAVLPSCGVGTPVNWPRKEPMAVRLAPTTTTSEADIGSLRCGCDRGGACPIMARNGVRCCSAASFRGCRPGLHNDGDRREEGHGRGTYRAGPFGAAAGRGFGAGSV